MRMISLEMGGKEKKYTDLSKAHRLLLLTLVSIGSSAIYGPIYLKIVFYEPLMQALNVTNTELNALMSIYGLAAVFFYFFSGIIADKVRMRTLSWLGYFGVAILTFFYAMLPSYNLLVVLFIGYAIFSILVWWGTRYKVVRLIYPEEEYPQKIGLSYGIYGAVGLVLSFIQTGVIAAFVDMATGVTVLLIVSGVIVALCGVATLLWMPKFEGEIKADAKNPLSLAEAKAALKLPAVWLAALTMFCVYSVYISVTFTTPFMSNVLAAPVVVVSVIGIIRSFGVSIIAAPAFGWLAKVMNSPSKVICGGMVAAIVILLALMFLPHDAGLIVVVAVLVCLLSFVTNGLYGITSGQLSEAHIPPHLFGAGVGVISIIGLCPDAFLHVWFGTIMDAQGNDAYNTIFMIMIAFAVAGIVFAALTLKVGKKNLAKQEAEKKASGAADVR